MPDDDQFFLMPQTQILNEGDDKKKRLRTVKAAKQTGQKKVEKNISQNLREEKPVDNERTKLNSSFSTEQEGTKNRLNGEKETEEIALDFENESHSKESSVLRIPLSQSLFRKIKTQSEEEGISINDFVKELLAEGVVLRAWEIVEKKGQMRNPQGTAPAGSGNHRNSNNGNNKGSSGNGTQRNNGRHKGHRGMSHGRYQSIMDDKATFLEYVRNQEKNRR